jgi:hypothetical protein
MAVWSIEKYSELDEIADAFIDFAKDEKFCFWR